MRACREESRSLVQLLSSLPGSALTGGTALTLAGTSTRVPGREALEHPDPAGVAFPAEAQLRSWRMRLSGNHYGYTPGGLSGSCRRRLESSEPG